MQSTPSTYALILAGGSGTRFWPLSRDARPKQLLDLFGTGTLLEQTIRRLEGLVPLENIHILTNAVQEAEVRAVAHMLPPGNILAEPAKRDTAPAVALGIGWIAARDPQARMLVLPSDQMIRDEDEYRAVMRSALETASASDGLVTIGIRPTWPCPSYGYIERGVAAVIGGYEGAHTPHEVVRFREKPNAALAAEFLAQGGFAWNAGMFVWSLPVVTAQLEKHAPELAGFVAALREGADLAETVATRFPALTPISIDFALMEKADRVLNIEADFGWDDIGSWISVAGYLEADAQDNRSNQPISALDARGNIAYSSRPGSRIALLGVEDLIVVQTEDALLVARRDQADAIKNLAPLLPRELL